MMVAPFGRMDRLALRAAGFIATSTLGESPGVEMSWSEMCTWKADTPASVPARARISAGKSGKVARSFPSSADVVVKRSPVNCMPSPESPANRMTTRCRRWWGFGSAVGGPAPRRSGDGDGGLQIDVLDGVDQCCALGGGALERLSTDDQPRTSG